jgi:hypothetical protein
MSIWKDVRALWKSFEFCTALIATAISSNSYADNGSAGGTISSISVLGPGSGAPGGLDFRVTLTGNPVFCSGYTWAYLNSTDANYDEIVANILAARALGASVIVYWNSGSTGYCQISSITW